MNGEVIGAIISAAASIVVALIGRIGHQKSAGMGAASLHPGSSVRPWMMTGAVLAVWFLAVALIWPQLSKHNFLLVPPVMVVLVLVRPIPPIAATLITAGLFAWNVAAGLVSNRLIHKADPQPVIHSLPTFLLFAGGWALLVYVLSVWRSKVTIVTGVPVARQKKSIVTDLQKLAQLYHRGNLSTDEFFCAKASLLGRVRHHRAM